MGLLALVTSRIFSPHLAYILQNQIKMAVEGPQSAQQLAVIPAGDDNLSIILDGVREY